MARIVNLRSNHNLRQSRLAFDGLKGPDAQLVPGNDLVSYNEKHNEANGEYNRDGHSNHLSWNHGVEGPTDDQAVKSLRFQQTRNLLATLLLSRGTPMILAGDEVARTRTGNNNAYAQDNEISWLDWEGIDTGAWDLFGFAKKLD